VNSCCLTAGRCSLKATTAAAGSGPIAPLHSCLLPLAGNDLPAQQEEFLCVDRKITEMPGVAQSRVCIWYCALEVELVEVLCRLGPRELYCHMHLHLRQVSTFAMV